LNACTFTNMVIATDLCRRRGQKNAAIPASARMTPHDVRHRKRSRTAATAAMCVLASKETCVIVSISATNSDNCTATSTLTQGTAASVEVGLPINDIYDLYTFHARSV